MLKHLFATTKKERRTYLDNAGATEMSKSAKDALMESLTLYGNPSGIHKEGALASVLLDKARALCATELNAHAYEIYFTGSGTESCNVAVLGTYFAYTKNKKGGDALPHIITSSIEHPAILESVKHLEGEGKVTVTYLPVYDNGLVKVKDLREALSENTILVSVMYANNEIGTIQPIKEIGRAVDEWKREQGKTFTSFPYVHTDACQAANYLDLDILRLKVHMMTLNSSKCHGPKGVALLYKREGLHLVSPIYGGGQERSLRSGTENVASAYAFGVALKESQQLREKECERLRTLRDKTVDLLKNTIPDIVIYGAFDEYHVLPNAKTTKIKNAVRLPNNINCRVPGISSEEMILRLDAKGFAVSHKSACASMETDGSYVLQALGITEEEAKENIRISMGRATTEKDMVALVNTMKEISVKYRTSN
jgi:cysteine desulfurase